MRARRFAAVLAVAYAAVLLFGVLRSFGSPELSWNGDYGAVLNPFAERYEWAFSLGCLAKAFVVAVAVDRYRIRRSSPNHPKLRR